MRDAIIGALVLAVIGLGALVLIRPRSRRRRPRLVSDAMATAPGTGSGLLDGVVIP